MSRFEHTFEWTGPSGDPADEQFGDVVEAASLPDVAGDPDAVDAVLVGEPYDGAVIGRPGAREGPAALREHLAATKTHHFDAGPVGAVADLGDVTVLVGGDDGPDVAAGSGDVAAVQERVRAVAAAVHDLPALPVFLGGDNSLSYPNAAPLVDRGTLGVVNFDAHLDVRAIDDGPTSGTPYRQLLDAGLDAYACVGARHFETSTAYHDYLREEGGAVVTAEEVGEDPVAAVDAALDALGGVDRVYASVDLDVLDAAYAPGVSAPTPGGLSPRELFRALRVLAGGLGRPGGPDVATADDGRADAPRLAGFEVVECAPPLDDGGRTARAGARAVAHVLAAAGVGSGDGAGSRTGTADAARGDPP